MPGAEVVDREPLAHRVQERQHLRGGRVDDGDLRQLEDEAVWCDAPRAGELRDGVRE